MARSARRSTKNNATWLRTVVQVSRFGQFMRRHRGALPGALSESPSWSPASWVRRGVGGPTRPSSCSVATPPSTTPSRAADVNVWADPWLRRSPGRVLGEEVGRLAQLGDWGVGQVPSRQHPHPGVVIDGVQPGPDDGPRDAPARWCRRPGLIGPRGHRRARRGGPRCSEVRSPAASTRGRTPPHRPRS